MNALRRVAPYGLLVSVTLLSAFGLAMLYSTTADMYGERILTRQAIWLAIGGGLALGVVLIGYQRLGKLGPFLLGVVALPLFYLAGAHALDIVGVPSSLLSKLPLIGRGAVNGSWRWLFVGPVSIQPSEFAKVATILFLSGYYGSNPRYAESFKWGLLVPMGLVGTVLVAVLLGGSLSLTAISGCVVLGMLLVAGIRLRYFLIFIVVGLGLLWGVIQVSGERLERLTTFRDPEAYKADSGYQLWHSQLALGSGGWRGVGFNKSHLKEHYLPEAHTDFIMAIVGEEWGYRGILWVIVLYLALMGSALAIGITAPDRLGVLLGFGIGLSLGLHAFANLGVVSGLLPTTGVTAPLVSYGGSSMVSTWLGIGILLSIARTAQTAGDFLEEAAPDQPPEPVMVRIQHP